MAICSEQEIGDLMAELDRGTDDRSAIGRLLASYPEDPRLHFMLGSILAGEGDALAAHAALQRAVELAPDFLIARYQLGFFELTSGEADRALSTWGPLLRLPEDHYLRKFVEGQTFLIRDEFTDALALMREGIALNDENEPLNNDIRLLMRQVESLVTSSATNPTNGEGADQSAASVLLGQFGTQPTRH